MATNDYETNLIIRATDLSTQPIQQVVDQVAKLIATLKSQVEASRSGAASAGEFSKALRDVGSAADALIRQKAALADFGLREDRVGAAASVLQQRQAARNDFASQLPAEDERTKAQVRALASLDRSVAQAERAAARANEAYDKAASRLERLGVPLLEVNKAGLLLSNTLRDVGVALSAGNEADRRFIENKKQATEYVNFLTEALKHQEAVEKETARATAENAEKQKAASAKLLRDLEAQTAAEEKAAEARSQRSRREAEEADALRQQSRRNVRQIMYTDLFRQSDEQETARQAAAKAQIAAAKETEAANARTLKELEAQDAAEEKLALSRSERARREAEEADKLRQQSRRNSQQILYTDLFRQVDEQEATARAAEKASQQAQVEQEKLAKATETANAKLLRELEAQDAAEEKLALSRSERARREAEEADKLRQQSRRNLQQNLYAGLFGEADERDVGRSQQEQQNRQLEQFRVLAAQAAERNRAATEEANRPIPPRPRQTADFREGEAQYSAEFAARQATDPARKDPTLASVEAQVERLDGVLATGSRNVRSFAENLKRDIRAATDEVIRQARIVDEFTARRRAVADAEARVAEHGGRLEALRSRAETATSPEDAQAAANEASVLSRRAVVDAAALGSAKRDFEAAREALEKIGVTENEVFAATQRLTDAATNAARVLRSLDAEQTNSLKNLALQAKQRADALQAQAAAGRPSSGFPGAPGGASAAVQGALSPIPDRHGIGDISDAAAAVDRLSGSLKKGGVFASTYQKDMENVRTIQAKIAQDAGLIDAYRNQRIVVSDANAAMHAARAELDQVAAAVANAEKPTNDLEASLRRADAAFVSAAAGAQRENATLAGMEARLKASKLDANDLTASTEKLTGAAARLSAAQEGISKKEFGFLGLRPFELKNLEYQIGDVYTQLSLGQGIVRTFNAQADQIFQIFDFSIARLKLIAITALPAILALEGLVKVFERMHEASASLREFTALLTADVDGGRYTPKGLLDAQHQIERFGVSFADAGAAVRAFVREGLSTDEMVRFGKAAQDLVDVYGEKFPDALKEVTSAFHGGYEAVKKLDDEFNFLSAAERDHIRDLIESGHAEEARREAFEAFKKAQDDAATKSRTSWQIEVRHLTEGWHHFLDAIGNTAAFQYLDYLLTHTLPNLIAKFLEFFALIAKVGTLQISPTTFAQSMKALATGDPLPGPKQQELTDAESRRDLLRRAVETSQAARRPGEPESQAIVDLRQQLAQVEARIEVLKGEAGIEGLKQQLTAAEARRDALQRDKVEPSAPAATTSAPGVPADYTAMRDRVADMIGLDREAMARVQRSEGVRKNGKWQDSPTGAVGGMQVTPGTFADMKAVHPDIAGDNRDDLSNLLAGGYRLKDMLTAHGGDLKQAVQAYHDGPNHEGGPSEDARKQAEQVTAGYTGSPLKTGELAAVNAQIATLQAKLAAMPGAVNATADGMTEIGKQAARTGEQLERNKKQNGEELDILRRMADLDRDRNLRGAAAEDRDRRAVDQKRRDLLSDAGNVVKDGPLSPEVLAHIDELVKQEDDKLRERREKAAKADADRVLAEQKALMDRLASLRAQNDNNDKTNVEARRKAVVEEYSKTYEDIEKARRNGITNIAGLTLNDFQKQVDKERDTRLQQVTDDAIRTAKAREKALLDRLDALHAQNDNSDKTNPELRRKGVQEEYSKTYDDIDKARQNGMTSLGGMSLDAYTRQVDAAKQVRLEQVSAEADLAKVKAVDDQRKIAYKEIIDDLKKGAISLDQAFARIGAVAKKYAPTVKEAVESARRDLTTVGGANPSEGTKASLAKLPGAVSDGEDSTMQTAVKEGFTQLEELQRSRKAIEDQQKLLLKEGATTAEEAQGEIKKAFEATRAESLRVIATLQKQVELLHQTGKIGPAAYQEYTAKLKQAGTETKYVSDFQKELNSTIENSFVSQGLAAFDKVGQAIGRFAQGTESLKQVFSDIGGAFAQMAAGILEDIAKMILKTLLLKAIQAGLNAVMPGSGDATAGALGALTGSGSAGVADTGVPAVFSDTAAVAHAGWMIGSPGGMSRGINPAWFVRAPRFHDGGVVGLSADEVPAVLQKGEEVLSKSDARNKMNAGPAGGGTAGGGSAVRNVLAVGDKEIASAMSGAHGEKVVLNVLKRNIPTVRNWL